MKRMRIQLDYVLADVPEGFYPSKDPVNLIEHGIGKYAAGAFVEPGARLVVTNRYTGPKKRRPRP